MPKMKMEYPDQVNVLCKGGTLDLLRAIGYYRGEKGRYAKAAKDFIQEGCKRWIESLSSTERKRFESILETVKATSGMKD